ncbi:hypothetical protein EDD16DRAFT_153291 [Pisolithus croceorrhizus]|nr:hypothetical protein EDD16DRAFT_153291 [Pisolithus croceorrhizus]KAI6149960.1 hypothetical protein EDD17DRAFT_1206363 [Pisolithus thermaeus]
MALPSVSAATAIHWRAKLLASRCVLIKSVYEFYAQGSTYDELHAVNRGVRSRWEQYILDTLFKFTVIGYNHSLSQRWQRNVIENFSYMDSLGKIDMKDPDIVLGCFEDYRFHLTLRSSQYLNAIRRERSAS